MLFALAVNVRVARRCHVRRVTQIRLNFAQTAAILQQNRCAGVSKLVESENGSFSWKRKIEHGIIPSRAMVFAIVLFV